MDRDLATVRIPDHDLAIASRRDFIALEQAHPRRCLGLTHYPAAFHLSNLGGRLIRRDGTRLADPGILEAASGADPGLAQPTLVCSLDRQQAVFRQRHDATIRIGDLRPSASDRQHPVAGLQRQAFLGRRHDLALADEHPALWLAQYRHRIGGPGHQRHPAQQHGQSRFQTPLVHAAFLPVATCN